MNKNSKLKKKTHNWMKKKKQLTKKMFDKQNNHSEYKTATQKKKSVMNKNI